MPWLEATIPSLVDPTLASPGRHVMSIYVQYTPFKLKAGGWREKKDELGDVVLKMLETYAPGIGEQVLARQVVTIVQQLRSRDDLLKPPGVAETLDWARALHFLGTVEIDLATASATLGALVKYREDSDRVQQALDRMLAP